MSENKTPVIGHVTPLPGSTVALPVFDPATMRVTGEVAVDASLAVAVPHLTAPSPGSIWTCLDGTTYDVVRAEGVGDRPRWWVGDAMPQWWTEDEMRKEWEPPSLDDLHDGPAIDEEIALVARPPDASPRPTSPDLNERDALADRMLAREMERRNQADPGPLCTAPPLPAGSLFSLSSARALLASLERLDPDSSANLGRATLWTTLREACNEVERLRSGALTTSCAAPRQIAFAEFVSEMHEVIREARQTNAVDSRGRDLVLYFGDMMRRLEEAVDLVNPRLALRVPQDETSGASAIVGAMPDLPEDPDGESYDQEIARLKTDLKAAGDTAKAWRSEAERLRAQASEVESESAGFVALYDALGEAIETHLPGGPPRLIDCVVSAGADLAKARARLETIERAAVVSREKIRRLKERAKELEAMAEALAAERDDLVEERDGLTLRLGAKAKRDADRPRAKTPTQRRRARR